ncbi:hypothetical protein DevBK_04385 [Devosia sp. BK]|uniref:hypothetical protein n=1 Tax=Devosia sp. BK TaxID=2871706 RepID=UPI0029397569|nr:hypothetical protein [Devosia sp. BK]MDV3250567.1 hypothetical protein [Devosia sp. BK]
MSATSHSNTAQGQISGLMQNLAGIALGVLLLAVGAAYLVDQTSRPGTRTAASLGDGSAIVQTVGGRELTIPQNWFRFGEQMQTGFVSQVDLSVHLASGVVDVTLVPRSRARASSELLDSVYVHQFAKGTLSGVPGLIGQTLGGSGYAGEVLWYDALAAQPFVAKCIAPVEVDAASRCVRTAQLTSGLAAIYSFDATMLADWRDFDAQMGQWLQKIGAN